MSNFSMIDVNRVTLAARLTRDPELRYTSGGTAVTTLRVAASRKFTSGDQQKEETLFVDVVAWGKTAENCSQYLSKGRPVFIEGRLQSRSWEKDGQRRSTIEIVADRVQWMDYEPSNEDWSQGEAAATPPGDDDIPF